VNAVDKANNRRTTHWAACACTGENNLAYELAETFNNLDQGGAVIAEYVWIGGSGMDLRSKARTFTNGDQRSRSSTNRSVWLTVRRGARACR
jgi:hypothetical protein